MTEVRKGGNGFGIPGPDDEFDTEKKSQHIKIEPEASSNTESMNNEVHKEQSAEQEGGPGFGIPMANDDVTNDFSPRESLNHSVGAPSNSEMREGGGGFGIPQASEDINMATNSEDDSSELIRKVDDEYPFQAKMKKKKAAAVEKEFEAITLQKTFVTGLQKIFLSVLVFVAAILGFYTITQTINFIVQLKDWPALAKYPLYVAVGVFASIIIYFIFKLVRSWFTLKQSPQISLEMLSTLSKRRDLQNKCYEKNKEACDDLYAILKDINEDEYRNTLHSMHISEEEISDLSATRKDLCKRHEASLASKGREASREWFDSFVDSYQAKLDYLANERIKYYSVRGAITATISHIPSMDRFIILSAMFGLVKDLLGIYNIRPSKINTAVLLSKVVINTFCAGYIQEGAEGFGEGVNKALESFRITFNSLPYIKDFIGTSVTLGTEVTAHAFLIKRVGEAANKMLLPVIKK